MEERREFCHGPKPLALDIEPERKKRCIRFPSDLSTEDPLLVSDSGFSDFSAGKTWIEHGDSEVSPFFDLGENIGLFEDSNHPICTGRSQSLDSDSLATEELTNDLPEPDTAGVKSSESEESEKNGESSSSSQSSSGSGLPTSEDSWEQILNHSEISKSPGRTAMLQRFLSHLRNNPNDRQLQHFLSILLSGPEFAPPRQRLRHVANIQDVIRLLRCSKKILVLTGAGISVSCGIPDFRSKDGLYSRVSKVFPDLQDPQSVFDVRLFRKDPRPFFLTAKELYPGQFEPSLSHQFIRKLEARGQLLRNYSQNIDTLENIAGIENVTMCHGSFATATCLKCKFKVEGSEIKEKVLNGEVPYCPTCSNEEETKKLVFPLGQRRVSSDAPNELGSPRHLSFNDDDDDTYPSESSFPTPPVLKPDIVFFGEDLPDEFHNNLQQDKPDCDLLLVIGSSLRVRPVSLIPGMLPPEVPQILINRESLSHCRFDVELLGNCDGIISHLCRSLGTDFADLASTTDLMEIDNLPSREFESTQLSSDPKSEYDIQALKACWEPKVNENISERLPDKCFLNWRPRQYIYEGAEVLLDPDDDDEEDDDDDSSSSGESDSSISSNENKSDKFIGPQPEPTLSPKK